MPTRCLLLLAALVGWGLPAKSQGLPPDTLRLQASNEGPWSRYLAYCFDQREEPASGQQAVALAGAGRFRPMPPGRVFQAGFAQGRLWLRTTVVNQLPQRTRFVWSLYAFVDSATLWVQPVGAGPPRFVAGTSGRVVAARRGFPARASCLPFWLAAHERAVLYLAVENHTGATYLPTDITTTEDFLAYEEAFVFTHNWGWLLGLYLGSALLNLLFFAFLRDKIHLWYGAYIFFSAWFLLMEDGLDAWLLPQAAYTLGWRVGQFSLLLLALACQLRVLARFVRLRPGWPALYRLSWALSELAAAGVLAYGLLYGAALHAGAGALAWLNGGREILLWSTLLGGVGLLAVVVGRGRRRQRRLAALYGLTYAFFLLGCLNLLLNRMGVVNIHLLEPNALAWGLALELVLLSVLLTARFRYALHRNSELRLRRLRERAAAGQRLIAAQDEEREALAHELHDALAPGLTALHLAWQGRLVRQALAAAPPLLAEAHAHTEALLRQLRHEVRTLGQILLPTLPGEQPTLPEAVALLLDALRLTDEGPQVECYCDPAATTLPAPLQQAAYRMVAELLHNALRHAEARLVRVEVRCLPASLHLAVADDGRGFDPHGPPPRRGGLGLRGVRARAGYLRGQVVVSSQPGQGTFITVDLPL
ncbi:MAG: sensor histidine kinase [Janthinobacterium lividum]